MKMENPTRILLVYPQSPPSFWSMDYLLKLYGKKSCYPPLGLLTIAAMLPEEWEKRLVDLNVTPLRDEDLAWADYVFLTGMNIHARSAQAVINRCREAGVNVVAGGPLFTHEYERFDGVDYFILNEAAADSNPANEVVATVSDALTLVKGASSTLRSVARALSLTSSFGVLITRAVPWVESARIIIGT